MSGGRGDDGTAGTHAVEGGLEALHRLPQYQAFYPVIITGMGRQRALGM